LTVKVCEGGFQVMVKLGEVQSKMSADVRKEDELIVRLGVRGLNMLEIVSFKPSEDLKRGDRVKITIEKF
jgi:ribosomal 50S subunit-recycling heat shock protein